MVRMLLHCDKCHQETDMLPQLLSCVGWVERDENTLEQCWGKWIVHTISCVTPNCEGCWCIQIDQSEWVPLKAKEHREETP